MEPLSIEKALLIKSALFDHCIRLKSIGLKIDHAYIAGGCITSMIQNETPKDYDFFFQNQIGFSETIISLKDFKKDYETYNTKAAHTLKYEGCKYQFISRRYGSPEKTMAEFDFYHTKAWYDIKNHKLHISNIAYECAIKKLLIFNNIKDTSLHRAGSFFRRYYKMPREQYELLCFEFTEDEVKKYFNKHGIRQVRNENYYAYYPAYDETLENHVQVS